MRKVVKIIGLGIGIWGLSLIWPEINLGLTDPVLVGLGLGLCLVMLVYSLLRYLDFRDGPRQSKQQHSTRPVLKLLP